MQVDDVTVGLMVQQFLDEWHFRVLHSGLAYAWDRPEALIKAMDIFEAAGMRITLEEKEWHGQWTGPWWPFPDEKKTADLGVKHVKHHRNGDETTHLTTMLTPDVSIKDLLGGENYNQQE